MYKKAIVLATLLGAVGATSVAQLSYWGTAGGHFGLQTQQDAQFSNTSIDVELDVGIFLLKNAMLGGGFSIALQNQRPQNAPKQQNSLLRTGNHIFARYYIPATDNFQLFVGSKFDWQRLFVERGNLGLGTSDNEEFSQINLTAGMGANFFLHKDVALETTFFLHFLNKRTPTPPLPLNSSLLDFSIGLRYFPRSLSLPADSRRGDRFIPPSLRQRVWTMGGAFQLADQVPYGLSLLFSPTLSYFPVDRFSLALRSDIMVRFDSAAHQFSLGTHARYHLGSGNTYFFLGGGMQLLQLQNSEYSIAPTKQDNPNSLQLLTVYGIGIGTFMSANVAIEGQIEYQHNIFHINRPEYSSVHATVGLRYYWPYEKL